MIARTSLTRKYLFFFYRISSYKIKRKILLVTWAKATVGDLFRSPTIGDLNFFFLVFCKININHWICMIMNWWLWSLVAVTDWSLKIVFNMSWNYS